MGNSHHGYRHIAQPRTLPLVTTTHVVLQASVVPNDPAASSAFARTASTVPLVLTGENTSQQQKLVGIRFGAMDFLEKPVALLKLRNVWQHTVRKVLNPPRSLCPGVLQWFASARPSCHCSIEGSALTIFYDC